MERMADQTVRPRKAFKMTNENSSEKKEKRSFKSKIENFWYYYKWHTVAALVILLAVGVGLSQCIGREDIDIVVYYLSADPITYSEDKINLKNAIEPYVRDYSGDGKVRIEIENYYIGEDYDPDLVRDNLKTFSNLYTAGSVMLIMTDTVGLKQMTDVGYFGDISDLTDEPLLYDGTVWNAEGSAFSESESLKNWDTPMYWGVRVFNEKSLISISKTKGEEYEFAREVLANIINDNKIK